MGIGAKRDLHILVPQLSLNPFDVLPLMEKKRCAGVAIGVKATITHPSFLTDTNVGVVDRRMSHWAAINVAGEDEVTGLPVSGPQLALSDKAFLLPKCSQESLRDPDLANVPSFCRGELQPTVEIVLDSVGPLDTSTGCSTGPPESPLAASQSRLHRRSEVANLRQHPRVI